MKVHRGENALIAGAVLLSCGVSASGTCYVEGKSALSGTGTISFISPTLSVQKDVQLDANGSASVSDDTRLILSVVQASNGTGHLSLLLMGAGGTAVAAVELPSLPSPGTYSLESLGGSVTCRSDSDADAAGCSSGCALGGGAPSSGGAAAYPGCGAFSGTVAVNTNSVRDCHPAAGSGEPPATICATDFKAQLTFSSGGGGGASSFSGSMTLAFAKTVQSYGCSGRD